LKSLKNYDIIIIVNKKEEKLMKIDFSDFIGGICEAGLEEDYLIKYNNNEDEDCFCCPFCQEIVYSTDYPFFEVDEETEHCICPICYEAFDV
jgi:hypothetical protein